MFRNVYLCFVEPWRAAWVTPIVQADKKLWMDTLRNATTAYNLTASELTQGMPGGRWDVVESVKVMYCKLESSQKHCFASIK